MGSGPAGIAGQPGGTTWGMWVGRGAQARAAYGLRRYRARPGSLTVNPNEVDVSWELCGQNRYALPIIAAAMDGGVVPVAIEMGRHGGLAVLNLEGIFSRYANSRSTCSTGSSRPARKKRPRSSSRSTASPSRRADPPAHPRDQEGRRPRRRLSIPQRAARFARSRRSRRRHLRRAVRP